jgi:hypothetical protein
MLIVIASGLMLILFAAGGVLVVRDTTRGRGRFGFNLRAGSVRCPRCGTKPPKFRVPANASQGLWGGWTCRECGCEYDKWGREVPENEE